VAYTATAYCQHGVTQSGVGTRAGIAAGDPVQLPVGSVVHVETAVRKYNGIYTVLDTGSKVLGHKVDLFMHDCTEAQQFGKQRARVTVLRKGWNPKASVPKTVVAGPAIR
jgi:3D (Asp-Asp-Asp) domain-containing protein